MMYFMLARRDAEPARRESARCLVCGADAPLQGQRNGYPFHRCPRCGLLFAWPLPEDTADIYAEDYYAGGRRGFGYVDYDRDKRPMAPTFEKYLDLLAKRQPPPGRLLDVGAATGFFLALARPRGWDVRGVDLSEYACQVARGKGLDVFCGSLEQYPAADASFDVVTMWDVIEHFPDPRGALSAAQRLLKPGGLLALNTPDAGSLVARLLGLRWHLVAPPEHLVLFHQDSLKRLLNEAGFEVLQTACIGKRFTVQYIAQTLAHWQGGPLWSSLAEALHQRSFGSWGVPVNLFDNLFLIARKRQDPPSRGW